MTHEKAAGGRRENERTPRRHGELARCSIDYDLLALLTQSSQLKGGGDRRIIHRIYLHHPLRRTDTARVPGAIPEPDALCRCGTSIRWQRNSSVAKNSRMPSISRAFSASRFVPTRMNFVALYLKHQADYGQVTVGKPKLLAMRGSLR